MRILVLGGTVFLSKAVAAEAVRRGHEVTCACRGASGEVPDGAELVVWDRDDAAPTELAARGFDAVVDVGRHPSRVRSAVATFASAHWVFVSTINVYRDESTPGGTPSTLPLRDPIHDDVDLSVDMEAYGPMKVACEQVVLDGAASATIIRPGLICGPEDPSGRFTYWPRRLGEVEPGAEVLAPGDPGDAVQVIDVRDLAEWVVDACESRLTGAFDGVGPVTTMGALLTEVVVGVGADVGLTWVDQGFLDAEGVQPWAGDDSVPLWLPRPAYDGMLAHDASPSLDAGLSVRPVSETARDTLAWLELAPDAHVTGIGRRRELEVLSAWRDRRADGQ